MLVVGAGGLGSSAALYLAAAGVGRLGIVDKDTVELSNLHRQIIHCEARQGQHKADSAAGACSALNSSIQVRGSCSSAAVHTDASLRASCCAGGALQRRPEPRQCAGPGQQL